MPLQRETNGELTGESVRLRYHRADEALVYLYALTDQLCATLPEAREIHAELTELFAILDEKV